MGWTFVIGGAPPTGVEERELTAAYGRNLTWRLDGSCTAQFSIDGRHPEAAGITALATDLHVYDPYGVKRFRGRIGPESDEIGPNTHSSQFTASDYRGMLAHRQIGAAGASFTGTNVGAIAWSLIQTSQALSGGNWGVTDGIGTGGGTNRDKTADPGKPLNEIIEEMARLTPGMEWEIDAAMALNRWYPTRGTNNGVVLDYGGLVSRVRRQLSPGDFANSTLATGSQGLTPEVAVAPTGGYFTLPGVVGNYLSTPDSAALDIVGDLEVVLRLAATDWTPGATSTMVSKYASGNASFLFQMQTSGAPFFRWSVAGTSLIAASSTGIVPFADGVAGWVKVTLDVDNGAAGNTTTFYTAADQAAEPTTWTTLGTAVTIAGVTSIFNSTAPLEIGSHSAGGVQPMGGTVYRTIIRNGIGGTTVFDTGGADVPANSASTYTCTTGQTVTVNRSGGTPTVAVPQAGGDIVTDVRGRWETSAGFPTIIEQTGLAAKASWMLAATSTLRPAYSVTLAPGKWQGATHIWLGDTVTLAVNSGRLAVNSLFRVVEVSVQPGDDGTETVSFGLLAA